MEKFLKELAKRHKWGEGPTKPLELLRKEAQDGETVLVWEEGAPVRVLSLCLVEIAREGKILVEVNQKFRGRELYRSRMVRPCEKMLAGEDPLSAALRGAKEELGILIKNPRLVSTRSVREPAKSYPGLMCLYTKHTVRGDDDPSFPDEDFWVADTSSNIEKNCFGWRYPEEVLGQGGE